MRKLGLSVSFKVSDTLSELGTYHDEAQLKEAEARKEKERMRSVPSTRDLGLTVARPKFRMADATNEKVRRFEQLLQRPGGAKGGSLEVDPIWDKVLTRQWAEPAPHGALPQRAKHVRSKLTELGDVPKWAAWAFKP